MSAAAMVYSASASDPGGVGSLPRYLKPGLRIVFIGYNPGLESARVGHYYAFRGNVFWKQLAASGLVDRPVSHLDDAVLMDEAGIGFIDLCRRPTLRASDLSPAELQEGSRRLLSELREAAPRFAVFSGRGIYSLFARHALCLTADRLTGRGDGPQPERLGPGVPTIPFVVPSSSGLASRWHQERLRLLRTLAGLL